MIRLDRNALADAVRSGPGFRVLLGRIEKRAIDNAQRIADTRVKRRTGAYVGNFETTVTPRPGPNTLARLRLFNSLDYADVIESGSRPHVIRATRAHGFLVFEIGGETVFTRNPVQHPGTRPQHVIRDALLQTARGL